MDQVVVFQKMFEQVRKEQNFSLVLFRIKNITVLHITFIIWLRITSELLLTMIRFCY